MFQAQYPSACKACDRGIKVGQAAEQVPGTPGEYRHAACPRPPVVCPSCWLEASADGSCGCGVGS